MVPIPAPPPDVAQDLVPACMVQAARDYSLPLRGLIAVWLTESGSGDAAHPSQPSGSYCPVAGTDAGSVGIAHGEVR